MGDDVGPEPQRRGDFVLLQTLLKREQLLTQFTIGAISDKLEELQVRIGH